MCVRGCVRMLPGTVSQRFALALPLGHCVTKITDQWLSSTMASLVAGAQESFREHVGDGVSVIAGVGNRRAVVEFQTVWRHPEHGAPLAQA